MTIIILGHEVPESLINKIAATYKLTPFHVIDGIESAIRQSQPQELLKEIGIPEYLEATLLKSLEDAATEIKDNKQNQNRKRSMKIKNPKEPWW